MAPLLLGRGVVSVVRRRVVVSVARRGLGRGVVSVVRCGSWVRWPGFCSSGCGRLPRTLARIVPRCWASDALSFLALRLGLDVLLMCRPAPEGYLTGQSSGLLGVRSTERERERER